MESDNDNSGLKNATNVTQEQIDKIKPKKTIKLASVLLTLLLIGIVVGPLGYIYYENKKEEERIKEEDAKIQKQMEEIAKKKETKEKEKEEPKTVEKDYTYDIVSYEEIGGFSSRTSGIDEVTKTATYKDENVTFLIEFTDSTMKAKLNDEIIYELSETPGEARVFKYNDYYVIEAGIEGAQFAKRITIIYDKEAKKIGKLENDKVVSYYAEFGKDYITFYEMDYPYARVEETCTKTSSEGSKVNTTSKYKITNGKLTLSSTSKEYCKE